MRAANLTHAEVFGRAAAVAVHAYRVDVDVRDAADPDNRSFPVRAELELTCNAEDTWLDFIGEVDEVTVDGHPRAVEYDGARIELTDLPPRRTIVTVSGRAYYSRTGEGMHRFVDPADGNTYLYTQYEPADARRVFPNLEQPDLRAPFHLSLTGPAHWQLLSNEPEVARTEVADGVVRVDFEPTKPLSTYITCFVAGPYHRVDDTHGDLDLALLCRQSIAEHLDADELFRLTKAGLDWFQTNFGPYPWGPKYHQVFVPEYNLGAMENPGLVTFTEHYLFRSAPTAAQLQARANTLVHEMSHMWFGDLVTCRWWGDLWLKESFAEFMGSHVSVEACGFGDGWVNFATARKVGAYLADAMPTTHPVVDWVADLEAAKTNFDRITYSKGASVLTQLVHYVGLDAFLRGARRYFAEHAYSSATLEDFMDALSAETDRDLSGWVDDWLRTAGHDTLKGYVHHVNGIIDQLAVQRDHYGSGDCSADRPHQTTVGLYRLKDGRLHLAARYPVTVDGPQVEVPEANGLPAPDAVLVNDLDHTFAQIGLDHRTRETLLRHVGDLDPLARAVAWTALWAEVRCGLLAPSRFVHAVLGADEQQAGVLTSLLERCLVAVDRYGAPAAQWVLGARRRAVSAEAGSQEQLLWTKAYLRAAALVNEDVTWVLDGGVPGLEVSVEIMWLAWESLAAQGRALEDDLDAPLSSDDTAAGRKSHLRCLAARPVAAVKEDVWARAHAVGGESNEAVDALLAGFNALGQDALRAPFAQRYFAGLEQVWEEHPIEIALRLVRGGFPRGGSPEAHRWLISHKDAPATLRRLLREAAYEDEIATLASRAHRAA